MNNAIETATTATTTKRVPRPLWGLVTDAVYPRIGDRSLLWGTVAAEVRRFLRLSGLDFRPLPGAKRTTRASFPLFRRFTARITCQSILSLETEIIPPKKIAMTRTICYS